MLHVGNYFSYLLLHNKPPHSGSRQSVTYFAHECEGWMDSAKQFLFRVSCSCAQRAAEAGVIISHMSELGRGKQLSLYSFLWSLSIVGLTWQQKFPESGSHEKLAEVLQCDFHHIFGSHLLRQVQRPMGFKRREEECQRIHGYF